MILLASTISTAMFLLGLALLTAILLRRTAGYYGRRSKTSNRHDTRPSDRQSRSSLMDAPADYVRWQVELHDLTRDAHAELHAKMSALSALLTMAQQESARLETAIATARELGIVRVRDPLEVIAEVDGSGENGAAAGSAALDELPPLSQESRGYAAAPTLNLRSKITALADRGLSASAIAERTAASIGEIELLLSTRTMPPRP